LGPGDLERILARLPEETVPELLTSVTAGEDAGVYKLADDLALVQTVDFFPPIVDDPYSFGQITAANALGDIYAMNGRPLTALNMLAVPCGLETDVVGEILRGGHDKVHEAGAVVTGGHTIEDDELKYGLAVTGTVDPRRMTGVGGAKPGDLFLLTKPLGTGLLATALKGGVIDEKEMADAIDSMRRLNAGAAEVLARHRVKACTDVTGFGLVGHLADMLKAGGVSAVIWTAGVPFFERAVEMASMGMAPAGLHRNREYATGVRDQTGREHELEVQCLFDPQTSGGLLAAVDPEFASVVQRELRAGPCPDAAMVGQALEGAAGHITIEYERK
jgi:selenide,water dikinase